MKRLSTLFLYSSLFIIVSCQTKEEICLRHDDMIATKADSEILQKNDSIDTPFCYLAEKNYDEWTKIRHIEDRINACNPAQEEAGKMTTEALVKSIVHYPLNYLVFAYNDPMTAINLVANMSVIHQEFEKRNDAAKVIIKLFSEIEGIEMNPRKRDFSDYKHIQFSDEMFLEYYMASGRISNLYSEGTLEKLGNAINEKIIERSSLPEVFSYSSLQPLLIMGASPELTAYVQSIPIPPSLGTTTVNTPLRKTITALTNQNYTYQEYAAISLYYVLEWPEAESIAPASNYYNCHSFAWHRQNEYNNVWINYYDSGSVQLSKYWTNDLYTPCTQQQAEIVFYDNSQFQAINNYPMDHSAVVLTDGLFVSKWGSAPLMIHEEDYCPYYYSNPNYQTSFMYFKEQTIVPTNTMQIYGDEHVSPGQGALYINSSFSDPNISYSWSITSYPTYPDYGEPSMYNGLYSNFAQVTFYGEGLYIIRVEASTNNTPDYHNVTLYYGEKYVYVY